jgi:hypothetical protein
VVAVDQIREKLFFVQIEADTYVARMPNLCGLSLLMKYLSVDFTRSKSIHFNPITISLTFMHCWVTSPVPWTELSIAAFASSKGKQLLAHNGPHFHIGKEGSSMSQNCFLQFTFVLAQIIISQNWILYLFSYLTKGDVYILYTRDT